MVYLIIAGVAIFGVAILVTYYRVLTPYEGYE